MEIERSSGILVHITSIPSKYGIGDFGPETYRFIDFLAETKQKLWQILPLNATNSPSPYSNTSAFAGHSWLISPDKLIEDKYLKENDLKLIDQSEFHDDYVHFQYVKQTKEILLEKAFEHFRNDFSDWKIILNEFYENEKYWIDDWTLFLTIREKYENSPWCDWPESLRCRDPSSLDSIRQIDQNRIEYHLFVQYLFFQQWNQLKKYANDLKIQIIGDMPIYLDYNSADIWSNQNLFQLDSKTLKPTVLAAFPPDHSSLKIQNWNMPIYDWNNQIVKPKIFSWWIKRLQKTFSTVDILRIDHFRGLESHYVLPVEPQTQKPITSQAHWEKTPGYEFFTAIIQSLGEKVPLIVEDLGDVTPEVFALRDQFKLHGVRILQMGFYYDSDNMYCPHNYIPHSFVYTGTHDNPTTLDWWKNKASKKEKEQFINYIHRPIENENEFINGLTLDKHVDENICWYFIQILFQSSANAAIVQMQDILNVQQRLNQPGIESSTEHQGPQNWSWRFQFSQITSTIKNRLKKFTQIYGRDLKYGKSIPPDDMILKDQSSCNLQ